jgi:hypothetical protein
LNCGHIRILDVKTRVGFVARKLRYRSLLHWQCHSCTLVACLLGCWTSQISKKPWEHVTHAIRKLDFLEDLRVHIVKGVQTALEQYDIKSEKLYESLAQLVLQSTDTLVPGALNSLRSMSLLTVLIAEAQEAQAS